MLQFLVSLALNVSLLDTDFFQVLRSACIFGYMIVGLLIKTCLFVF